VRLTNADPLVARRPSPGGCAAALPRGERVKARFAIVALVLALGSAPLRAAEPVRDFYNVLVPDGADPWIIREDGQYYMTFTTGDSVVLVRARTLSGLGAGERKVIWRPAATGPASRNIWAPEVHRLRGKWYVYVAADDGKNENHRMFALENPSTDPFEGEFVFKGKVAPPGDDHWAIDGTAFEAAGRLYFLWSGWPGYQDVEQILYIAPMSDPLTISGPRVAISRPEWGWETYGKPNVNEGPDVLVRDGDVHVMYSASGAWTNLYCLGRLEAREDDDLLDPCSWRKAPEPVFRGDNGVIAPGHAGFVRSPDDREDWIIYHAAKFPGSSWSRVVRMQPFTWSDGAPVFGSPAPPDRPIALPGGEPPRVRIECEDGPGTGRPVVPDKSASGGAKLAGEGAVELSFDATTAGPHALAVRHAWSAAGRERPPRLSLVVNGQPAGQTRAVHAGGNWTVAYLPVALRSGANVIRIEGDARVALDCVDVIPAP
jgi:GH43 family beta-xylosidase